MNQSTFLISRFLIEKHSDLRDLSGSKIRELLHRLLTDPLLWKKMQLLENKKYTKRYQPVGQQLERFDFYPFPEDWCLLSILSNGSGYSRCYIFIYLLEFLLGERELKDDGTPDQIVPSAPPFQFFCGVRLDIRNRIYHRKLRTEPQHPDTPRYPIIRI